MNKYLVSFYGSGLKGNDSYWEKRQENLSRTAKIKGGIDGIVSWNMDMLKETDYYQKNKSILDEKIGAGFWAWKPYIIKECLEQIPDGDVLFYCDVGSKPGNSFEINMNVDPLVDWVLEHNSGFLPGFYRPDTINKIYTKRDAFVYMNCNSEKYWNHPQVGATFSVWTKTDESMKFIEDWLFYAHDRRVISDDPNTCGKSNFCGFVGNRHDQSILTNLVIKHNIKCYPKTVGSGKNLTSLIQLIKIDEFCMDNFGETFGLELFTMLKDNSYSKTSYEKLMNMLAFFANDNPEHNGYSNKPIIMDTVFNEDGEYEKYISYNVLDIISDITEELK